jgi:hypothetical protein
MSESVGGGRHSVGHVEEPSPAADPRGRAGLGRVGSDQAATRPGRAGAARRDWCPSDTGAEHRSGRCATGEKANDRYKVLVAEFGVHGRSSAARAMRGSRAATPELVRRLDERLAVRVDLEPCTDKRGRLRTFLRISWVRPRLEAMPLTAARAGGVVGVELNADHLAVARVDTAGNPAGRPIRVPLDLAAPPRRRVMAGCVPRSRRFSSTPGAPVPPRSASRTWTLQRTRPGRSSGAARASGTSSPASPPVSSRDGSLPWRTPKASR